jgi:hypothetical protein
MHAVPIAGRRDERNPAARMSPKELSGWRAGIANPVARDGVSERKAGRDRSSSHARRWDRQRYLSATLAENSQCSEAVSRSLLVRSVRQLAVGCDCPMIVANSEKFRRIHEASASPWAWRSAPARISSGYAIFQMFS